MCDIKITVLRDAIALKDLTILPANGIKNVNTIEEAQSLLDSLRTRRFSLGNPWAEKEFIFQKLKEKALENKDFLYHEELKKMALEMYF